MGHTTAKMSAAELKEQQCLVRIVFRNTGHAVHKNDQGFTTLGGVDHPFNTMAITSVAHPYLVPPLGVFITAHSAEAAAGQPYMHKNDDGVTHFADPHHFNIFRIE